MPDPITGVSFANETIRSYLARQDQSVRVVNTHVYGGVSNAHGRFSIRKALSFLGVYSGVFKTFTADVLYLTPGQTFWGIVKYAPFILLTVVLGKPYVIHLHGNYMGKEYSQLTGVKKRIFRFLVGKASAGIALSESLRANFDGLLPGNRVFSVPNFVEERFMEQACQDKVKTELRCLYFSNLMKEKGCLDFLRALEILKEKGAPFSAVVAGGYEEESRAEVSELLEKLKPEVDYVGVLKGKAKIDAFRNTNVFVLPTYYPMEGQPISILEAMAAGSVIITTRHAGIPDILDESNALFVEAMAPERIASALENLYQSPELFSAFYKRNVEKAREEYTEERFGRSVLDILNKALVS